MLRPLGQHRVPIVGIELRLEECDWEAARERCETTTERRTMSVFFAG